MTPTLARWQALWEKVPELRPEGLMWDASHWQDGWLLDGPMIGEVHALALIRDAAARYFLEQGKVLTIAKDMYHPGRYEVRVSKQGEYSALNPIYKGESLDAALLVACELEAGVLDATGTGDAT